MKYLRPFFKVFAAFSLAVLFGCGQAQSGGNSNASAGSQVTSASTSQSSQQSADSKPEQQAPSGNASIADHMSERYASFDAFDAGIADGTSIPASLSLWKQGGDLGHVYDKDAIVDVWNALKQIRINTSESKAIDADAEEISFMFDSYRETIPFDFYGTTYAKLDSETMCPVENPAEVEALMKKVADLAKENAPKVGEELPSDNGAYLWDANGDGSLEHLWLDFEDNGDEALSATKVRLFGGGIDAEGYIDGAYDIQSVRLAEDDKGSYVVVEYTWGGHSSEGGAPIESSTIRLVGNELAIEGSKA